MRHVRWNAPCGSHTHGTERAGMMGYGRSGSGYWQTDDGNGCSGSGPKERAGVALYARNEEEGDVWKSVVSARHGL